MSLQIAGCLLLVMTLPSEDSFSLQGGESDRKRPIPLTKKYAGKPNVLRAVGEILRQDAIEAPLPEYPPVLAQQGLQGLVVVELVVDPAGRMREHLIHESFHPLAAQAVVEALGRWQFHTNDQLAIMAGGQHCPDCIRISRLSFDFVMRQGKPAVIDLAQEEVRRRGWPNPFDKIPKPGRPAGSPAKEKPQ